MKKLKHYSLYIIKLTNFSVGIFFTAIPNAFAYGSGSGIPAIDSILNAIVDLLTSDIARLVGLLSIIGIGYATLELGKIPKARGIYSCIGIGIIFGAGAIASKFGFGS